jgi:hypothetical protein
MAIKQRDRRHHKAARKSERGTKQDSPAASPVGLLLEARKATRGE